MTAIDWALLAPVVLYLLWQLFTGDLEGDDWND